MSTLFGFLCFISFVLFFIGLIKPSIVIRWGDNRGRKEVIKYYVSAFILTFIFAVSFHSGAPSRAFDSQFPYKFVDTKNKKLSIWTDTMDLYFCTEPIDTNQLKEFCKIKKDTFSTDGTYYLVIFDAKENAVFPKAPFGGMYGAAEDEEASKHIKAIYVFKKMNGFSELRFYKMHDSEKGSFIERI
ncbi:MAG: hypothetical protein WDA74_06165 [Spirochaetota bacterium]